MNRIVLLGVLGVAVIAAALALNYAIYRDEPASPVTSPPSEEGAAPGEQPSAAASAGSDGAPSTTAEPAAEPAPEAAATEQPGPPSAPQDGASGAGDPGDAATAPPEQPAAAPGQPEVTPPEFDIVRVNPAGEAVVAGRAEPGAEVTIMSGDTPLGSTTADEQGEWVILPERPLQPGNHELGLVARGNDGEAVAESSDVVVVVVPEPEEGTAEETGEARGQALALAVPREGGGPARVLQAPGVSEGISDDELHLGSVDYGAEGDLTIGGRAEPGADLQVYLDNRLLGTTEADEKGQWSLTPEEHVAEGMHELRVDQIGQDGTVEARVETPFQRTELNDWPEQQVVVVQPGNSLWRLARRMYGQGVRYTVIYEANRAQIADPDLIYPGQVFVVPPGQDVVKPGAAD